MSDGFYTKEEMKKGFNEFETTIISALKNEIDYSKYHFVLDEDGQLVFLKRDDKSREKEYQKEKWPCNSSDGIEMWSIDTGNSRGTDIVSMFLDALKIKYLM